MAIQITREGYVAGPRGKTWYQIAGSGDGLPLITVHGGPGGTHDYLEPLQALGDERPVVFYDQLGAGNSDIPSDVSVWNNDLIVAELKMVLDELAFDRVHLLGHSWGTIIAIEYALKHQDRLKSLVLSSPCASIHRYAAGAAALREALPGDVREVLEQHEAAGTTHSPEYEAASMEFYSRHVCRLEPWPDCVMRTFEQLNVEIYERMQGPNEFVINGIHKDYDITDRLSELKMPALFICGRYDEIRPEDTAYYASLVPGSELQIFEESSHLPHLEEPEKYRQVLRDFLDRVEGAQT